MSFEDRRDYAEARDLADPLARQRREFNFPLARNGTSPVYFCGHSLGLQPRRAVELVEQELANWRDLAVDGHFRGDRPWLSYHRQASAGFAELAGAAPIEVVAMNSLTVNLHLLMAGFYRPTPDRYKIVVEAQVFPSDRFAVTSQLLSHGFDPTDGLLEWQPRKDDGALHVEDLRTMLDSQGEQIALLLLPGVQYYSGQVLDMKSITALGHKSGCIVGLDLAHAIGNIELALHEWGPDFAAWCSYKYLNGGPGAVAGAFVHERHLAATPPGQLRGWWGHDEASRFTMSKNFIPAPGAESWQLSNPPILALAPVVASLELFREVGLDPLIGKSRQLTDYLAWLIEQRFGDRLTPITPSAGRGCQLSLLVRDHRVNPRSLFDALCRRNVSADWREPDIIRVAPVPLYNSFSDVFEFSERLQDAWDAAAT